MEENKPSVHESLSHLYDDNIKLVKQFGAQLISDLDDVPDFYTFRNKLIYSHRDFDTFFKAIKKGEKCAIVSGFNASGTPHLGHIPVFDTNLYFQKEYGIKMFVPISDDESYVSQKVETQEQGLRNSLLLARVIIAFGFDTEKTKLIIDQLYTNIYNLAIKLSKGLNLSEIKAVYGYAQDQNIGLHFYPSVQAAHILFPQTLGIENVLVPIGADEDAHLRVCRDLADKFGFKKPAALHSVYMPGLDGEKMSKSRGNSIFFMDGAKEIKKKIMAAYSGGQPSVEEHRRLGGNPEIDIAYMYLKSYFLDEEEAKRIASEYKKGVILSGEMKQMLYEKVMDRIDRFMHAYSRVNEKDLEKAIMANEGIDIRKLLDRFGVFDDH